MNFCESCGSQSVSLVGIRSSLDYWVCKDCGHCLRNLDETADDTFAAAQQIYFSDNSAPLPSELTIVDREILATRQAVTERYLDTHESVLEVGPGAGFFAQSMTQRGYPMVLVEHSEPRAKALRERIEAEVLIGAFEDCDIENERFKAVFSFHVIEHVVDPLRHLQQAIRITKPSGLCFLATPNSMSWQQRIFPKLSPNFDEAHLRVFSQVSLIQFCKKAGWDVVEVSTPDYASSWLRVITKLLRKARQEDESSTAGKYSKRAGWQSFYRVASAVMAPLRHIQRLSQGGNELFLVLVKPRT